MKYISTGIKALDKELNGGLARGMLTVIAGRPGTRKTSMAIKISSNMASKNTHIIFFSLEMSEKMVSSMLGHAQTSTTLNIYTHAVKKANVNGFNSVANAILA